MIFFQVFEDVNFFPFTSSFQKRCPPRLLPHFPHPGPPSSIRTTRCETAAKESYGDRKCKCIGVEHLKGQVAVEVAGESLGLSLSGDVRGAKRAGRDGSDGPVR